MKGPTELESGSLAVPVVYTEPDSEETLDLQTKGSCAKSALEGKRVLQLWRAESQWYPSDVLDGVHLKFVGGLYDVVNVVPRGTGSTLPFFCYQDKEERVTNFRAAVATNASDTSHGEVWTEVKNKADACAYAQNNIGVLIGTAFTARGIMNTLEQDGKQRWWGHYYGTLLGSTLVAMSPDKIDKAVLDGVMNAHDYYHIGDITKRYEFSVTIFGANNALAAFAHFTAVMVGRSGKDNSDEIERSKDELYIDGVVGTDLSEAKHKPPV
ncbi:hypothetical protein PENSTE_c049G01472 [Penicillium steckii]|uniref:Uncharacterized protein n=1 Tax=Penicillium steckii TaxID=303698 RepID=A0A1V6SIV1_9EURO|nr:hypothetical protein PENSTE_c049G01472 [Penicillium steckii]